ncbi:MAG: TIGR03086 family metal-binding protein, partial [Acidimicrobiales bacterium]
DLAAATGGDRRVDPELVDAIAAWFANREDLFRGVGIISERPAGIDSDDPQDRLILAYGRRPDWPG